MKNNGLCLHLEETCILITEGSQETGERGFAESAPLEDSTRADRDGQDNEGFEIKAYVEKWKAYNFKQKGHGSYVVKLYPCSHFFLKTIMCWRDGSAGEVLAL